MSEAMNRRLFGAVMFWTGLTTIFGWLPLIRIIGRPEGYTWGILGLSGAGWEGPFWIFILLTIYAVALLFTAFRGPRVLFYPMLILWHLAVTAIVVAGIAMEGWDATWQGQGLHFSIPMWLLAAPFALFTSVVILWVALDHRKGGRPPVPPWSRTNTLRLAMSVALMIVALALFRTGTNYNWVTAAAIVVTIAHWIMLIQSFGPAAPTPPAL